jgi:alkylation response protein AidB-like acyl-CoA dehydrogenase
MSVTEVKTQPLNGGEFLIKESSPAATFVPESFGEESLMIKGMVEDFIKNEILPHQEAIEKQEPGVTESILEKAAELGLLGSHMPETYGGMELDVNTNTLIGDVIGPVGSWTVSFAAHTGNWNASHFIFRYRGSERKVSPSPDLWGVEGILLPDRTWIRFGCPGRQNTCRSQ